MSTVAPGPCLGRTGLSAVRVGRRRSGLGASTRCIPSPRWRGASGLRRGASRRSRDP